MLSRITSLSLTDTLIFKASTIQGNLFLDTHKSELTLVSGTCKATEIFFSGEGEAHAIGKILWGDRSWVFPQLVKDDPVPFGDGRRLQRCLSECSDLSPFILKRNSISAMVSLEGERRVVLRDDKE
jgi:hypothetical protein